MKVNNFTKALSALALIASPINLPLSGAYAADLPRQGAERISERQLAQRIDQYVKSFAESGLFSGVVRVEDGQKVIFERAYGVAERSFGVPVTTDTRFMIASLSKTITSAAVARLVDKGKLSFSDPISRYIPGIPNGDRITVEELLNHHSGLDSPDRLPGSESWMRLPNTTEQLVDRVRGSKPAYAPGERYFYANANYWILANLIERLSGMSYGEFLQSEIFGPLGMKNTGHRADLLQVIPHLASGYAPDGLHGYRLAELIDWTSKTGNGSLYSTSDDYARFYHALVTNRLLRPDTTRLVLGVGKPLGYAWFRHNNADPRRSSIWFNGRSPGYTAYFEAYPQVGKSFTIMSNLYVYSPTVMANGLEKILWGEPYELQKPILAAKVKPSELEQLAGMYEFGPTFFVRNGRAEIVPQGDYLLMRWQAGGLTSTLIPLGNNDFFDPTFWATLKFEKKTGGWTIGYQAYGFKDVYLATSVPK